MNSKGTTMTSIRKLQTEGKVYVEYPPELRTAVQKAMDSWIAFCNLPDEVKTRFPYEIDSRVSGNGYELKTEVGETLDRKEDFHLRLNAAENLVGHAHEIGTPEIESFVRDALELPLLIAPILADFAKRVENEFNVPGFAEDVAYATPDLLLRFLHYFGDVAEGNEIASPHIDKGGFTMHLYESDGGVEQLMPNTREWQALPVSHEETVIFPAFGLQHKMHNHVQALCHRVVATADSAVNGRFSAVCFVDFRNNKQYDKKNFGRLQDWPVGFNYDISWEDMDKLFKP